MPGRGKRGRGRKRKLKSSSEYEKLGESGKSGRSSSSGDGAAAAATATSDIPSGFGSESDSSSSEGVTAAPTPGPSSSHESPQELQLSFRPVAVDYKEWKRCKELVDKVENDHSFRKDVVEKDAILLLQTVEASLVCGSQLKAMLFIDKEVELFFQKPENKNQNDAIKGKYHYFKALSNYYKAKLADEDSSHLQSALNNCKEAIHYGNLPLYKNFQWMIETLIEQYGRGKVVLKQVLAWDRTLNDRSSWGRLSPISAARLDPKAEVDGWNDLLLTCDGLDAIAKEFLIDNDVLKANALYDLARFAFHSRGRFRNLNRALIFANEAAILNGTNEPRLVLLRAQINDKLEGYERAEGDYKTYQTTAQRDPVVEDVLSKLPEKIKTRRLRHYFNILDLKPSAAKAEINKVYRNRALASHPDKCNPADYDKKSKEFIELKKAKDVVDGNRPPTPPAGPAPKKATGIKVGKTGRLELSEGPSIPLLAQLMKERAAKRNQV